MVGSDLESYSQQSLAQLQRELPFEELLPPRPRLEQGRSGGRTRSRRGLALPSAVGASPYRLPQTSGPTESEPAVNTSGRRYSHKTDLVHRPCGPSLKSIKSAKLWSPRGSRSQGRASIGSGSTRYRRRASPAQAFRS